jgi:hypothetical protein
VPLTVVLTPLPHALTASDVPPSEDGAAGPKDAGGIDPVALDPLDPLDPLEPNAGGVPPCPTFENSLRAA